MLSEEVKKLKKKKEKAQKSKAKFDNECQTTVTKTFNNK